MNDRLDALRELLVKHPPTTTPRVIYDKADEKKVTLKLTKARILRLLRSS